MQPTYRVVPSFTAVNTEAAKTSAREQWRGRLQGSSTRSISRSRAKSAHDSRKVQLTKFVILIEQRHMPVDLKERT
ncbi:hypothetical protein KTE96_08170 [Burkholderia multivorans]|uniref:hypothetical protein n=1 Tax=Burkholderia multivorans TaxID=87883 RepID=UPI001C230DB5|nr:hypothetical protein [Burkholderia multivorans]MBU9611701.1 hypothetical protein [Burkholderia multivorans]